MAAKNIKGESLPKVLLDEVQYQDLHFYLKSEVLYALTFHFTRRFLPASGDRTVDQMVQAARSGKQNIVEGLADGVTSTELQLKLLNVARASLKELRADYEDYLRTRHLEQWPLDDPRTRQVQEYSKRHNRPEHYTKDIEKRSPEALCNIAITLIHQYDTMMGSLLDRLQTDFVENGGIREQMTAARLGYRNEQKAEIARLTQENVRLSQETVRLKARIAELEAMIAKEGGQG